MSVLRIFGAVLRRRELRRVELAYAGFSVSQYAMWVAILVYAYGRGGTSEASLVAVVQLVPSALAAPFLGTLGDRHPASRVLLGGYLAQAAGMGATAAAIALHAPVAAVVGGAVIASTAVTVTRPAQAVLLPSLACSPDELTAANVVTSWVENGGSLVAGVVTGIALGLSGPGAVFAIMAAVALASAALVAGVPSPVPAPGAASAAEMALGGLREIRGHRHLRPLVGLVLAVWILIGALDVLLVLLAIDVLGLDDSWVGFLNAAWSSGGLVGGLAAAALVGRHRLSGPVGLGILLCGGAFAVLGSTGSTPVALVLLVVGGGGRALVDVGVRTLLQRTTSAEILGRVFGLLEGVAMTGLGIGVLLVPALVAVAGPRAALVGTGLLLPVVGVVVARPFVAVDRRARVPVVEIALLRSMPLFSALPAAAVEGIAHALEPLAVPAGGVVIRHGDEGTCFYAVADGELEVSRDGQLLSRVGRGAALGEIALLEDVPRTADVVATTDARLFRLAREPFVTAVTGHASVRSTATALVARRRRELDDLAVRGRRSAAGPVPTGEAAVDAGA